MGSCGPSRMCGGGREGGRGTRLEIAGGHPPQTVHLLIPMVFPAPLYVHALGLQQCIEQTWLKSLWGANGEPREDIREEKEVKKCAFKKDAEAKSERIQIPAQM